MGSWLRTVAAASAAIVLVACSTAPPLDTQGVNRALSASGAARQPTRVAGQRVVWGGAIVQARNLRDRTELEVLAYPLDAGLAPDTSAPAQGRFLADKPGYLETVDYAPGREVTVVGTVRGVRPGKVGAATYRFPVVTVQQLYLWPARPGWRSNAHFGVGVGVMVR